MDWRAVLPRSADVPAEGHPSFDSLLDAVRADLRDRLRAVCASMPAADFAALVETMAQRALRWRAFADQEFSVQSSR